MSASPFASKDRTSTTGTSPHMWLKDPDQKRQFILILSFDQYLLFEKDMGRHEKFSRTPCRNL